MSQKHDPWEVVTMMLVAIAALMVIIGVVVSPRLARADTADFPKGLQGQMLAATTAGQTYTLTGGRTMAVRFENMTGSAGRVCIAAGVDGSAVTCTGTDADFDNGHIVLEAGHVIEVVLSTGKVGYVSTSTARVWALVTKPSAT